MTYGEFQQQYEMEGEKLFNKLNQLDEDALLRLIENGHHSPYQVMKGNDQFQLWAVLQNKGTQKSIWPLFKVVKELNNEYLVRYHACNALFCIARLNDEAFKGEVQYGLNKDRQPIDQVNAIGKLESILRENFGAETESAKMIKPWWRFW